jgi:hypothetical protein
MEVDDGAALPLGDHLPAKDVVRARGIPFLLHQSTQVDRRDVVAFAGDARAVGVVGVGLIEEDSNLGDKRVTSDVGVLSKTPEVVGQMEDVIAPVI